MCRQFFPDPIQVLPEAIEPGEHLRQTVDDPCSATVQTSAEQSRQRAGQPHLPDPAADIAALPSLALGSTDRLVEAKALPQKLT